MPACRQTLPAAASLPPSSVLLANPRLGQPRVVLLGLGPGCCCSEGGEGGEGGDKTWCCILEQASAGHATWGISETETEKNMDITEQGEDSLSVKWPSHVWWVSKTSKVRGVMMASTLPPTTLSANIWIQLWLSTMFQSVGPQDWLQPCSVFRMLDWSVLISNKRFVYYLSPRILDKQLTGGLWGELGLWVILD